MPRSSVVSFLASSLNPARKVSLGLAGSPLRSCFGRSNCGLPLASPGYLLAPVFCIKRFDDGGLASAEWGIRIGGKMRAVTGFIQYRAGELAADRILLLMGTFAGVVGSAILVGIAAVVADQPTFSASLVYSVCLLTMLGCSAAYNLASNASRREFLRKLDHAAIFLIIAGTYTPFTTCRLNGVWAIGMTAAIWTGAITGAVMKLIGPRGVERGSNRTTTMVGKIVVPF
jgi:Haemolysin-III related